LAAAELQTYVAKISGARLPIRAEAEDGTLFIIYDHQRCTLSHAGKRGARSERRVGEGRGPDSR